MQLLLGSDNTTITQTDRDTRVRAQSLLLVSCTMSQRLEGYYLLYSVGRRYKVNSNILHVARASVASLFSSHVERV